MGARLLLRRASAAAILLCANAFEQAVDNYVKHPGQLSGQIPDLHQDSMTPTQARFKCSSMPDCRGFAIKGSDSADVATEVHFKAKFEKPDASSGSGNEWFSYERKGLYIKHKGHVSGDVHDIIPPEKMLLSQAEGKCDSFPKCESFTFRDQFFSTDTEPVTVHFKGSPDISHDEDDATSDWITHRRMRLYTYHNGHVSGRFKDIGVAESLTVQQAQNKCLVLPGCRGFTYPVQAGFEHDPNWPFTIHFKGKVDVEHGDGSAGDMWVTHRRMGLFTKHKGLIASDIPDILQERMTVHSAQIKCLTLPECRGFTFSGVAGESEVMIYFKRTADVENVDGDDSPWTSYRRTGLYSHQKGHISGEAKDILVAKLTISEATAKCDSMQGCRGFTFSRTSERTFDQEGEETSAWEIHFKDRADWHMFDRDSSWVSYHRDDLGALYETEKKMAPTTTKRNLFRRDSTAIGAVEFESASVSEF